MTGPDPFGNNGGVNPPSEETTFVESSEIFDLEYLMHFNRKADPNNLIGARWMCKGSSFVLQGLSGIGKSSLLLQILISWAVGRAFFGIKPIRPLKIVLLQAENDIGDISEPFQDIVTRALKLTPDEFALLKENLVIKRNASDIGPDTFSQLVREQIKMHSPDMIVADPLLSYAGGDLSKQENMSRFLRHYMQPILNETQVVLGFLHHFSKPPKEGEGRSGPKMFNGFGSVEIMNWAREMISVYSDGESGVYAVDFDKRAGHTGLVDNNGNPTNVLYLRHATDGGIYWIQDGQDSNKEERAASKEEARLTKLWTGVVKIKTIPMADLKKQAKQYGQTQNAMSAFVAKLIKHSENSDQPIYRYRAHVDGALTNKKEVVSIYPETPSVVVQGEFDESARAGVN